VIGTLKLTADSAPLAEFNLPVGAAIFEGLDLTGSIAVEDDVFLPESQAEGSVFELYTASHHIPLMGVYPTGANVKGFIHLCSRYFQLLILNTVWWQK
jgi:hypothetical protein